MTSPSIRSSSRGRSRLRGVRGWRRTEQPAKRAGHVAVIGEPGRRGDGGEVVVALVEPFEHCVHAETSAVLRDRRTGDLSGTP